MHVRPTPRQCGSCFFVSVRSSALAGYEHCNENFVLVLRLVLVLGFGFDDENEDDNEHDSQRDIKGEAIG
jgi:hypothetical protein